MKEGDNIIQRLQEIVRTIEEYGSTDRARHFIAEKLNQIALKENIILKQVSVLRGLSQKIEQFDIRSFTELQGRWDKVPDKEKDIVREEIRLEKNKILQDRELDEMEAFLIRSDQDFRYCVGMGVDCLKSNQPQQARDWLLKSIKHEKASMEILRKMKEIENRLLKLTKKEFRTLKQEWKDEKG